MQIRGSRRNVEGGGGRGGADAAEDAGREMEHGGRDPVREGEGGGGGGCGAHQGVKGRRDGSVKANSRIYTLCCGALSVGACSIISCGCIGRL